MAQNVSKATLNKRFTVPKCIENYLALTVQDIKKRIKFLGTYLSYFVYKKDKDPEIKKHR